MTTWLLIDANAVAHRVYHAMGSKMSYGRNQTGMVYGFLRDITNLMEMHNTENIALCFDKGKCRRQEVYPRYKHKRRYEFHLLPQAEQNAKLDFRHQLAALRDLDLPEAGFRNVLHQDGFEADDIIASLVKRNFTEDVTCIIVSSDKDLYQLLAPNVMMWQLHKNRMKTEGSFREEWHVDPHEWPLVKAIAGCDTDDVEGVEGVGEKTAVKYVRGTLSETSQAFRNIRLQKSLWRSNLALVTLPYQGCPTFTLRDDEVTAHSWAVLCKRYGITTLQFAHPSARGKGLLR